MSTIFKKIIDREIPAKIIYEDDKCLAFYDVQPQAPVHVLLIPKKELKSLAEVQLKERELLGHLMWVAGEIARELKIESSGYRVVTNIGADGGQSVFHLHFHILGGRPMHWPPG